MFKSSFTTTIATAISTLTITALTACSVSVPDVPAMGGGNPGFSKPGIPGPAVEGEWKSLCARLYSDSYRQFHMIFKGDTVIRIERLYRDDKCANLVSQTPNQGRFLFIEEYEDGSYGVEYAFERGVGGNVFPQEKILVEENVLYIGNFQTGEAAQVLENEPLYRSGTAPTPNPSPTPGSPITATLASSYSEAKYAFCNTQGRAVIVDFQGASMAADGTGTAKIGSRTCNSSAPFTWRAAPTAFTVSIVNGVPHITFAGGDSSYPDYIRATVNYTGLRNSIETFARFGGNTGGCYFSTNGGTRGNPFMDTCN